MTYSFEQVDAALCIWEEILTLQFSGELPRPASDYKLRVGTVQMRGTALSLAADAVAVWGAMTTEEQDSCDTFDWDFIPAFVALVDWSGTTPIFPFSGRQAAERLARDCERR